MATQIPRWVDDYKLFHLRFSSADPVDKSGEGAETLAFTGTFGQCSAADFFWGNAPLHRILGED